MKMNKSLLAAAIAAASFAGVAHAEVSLQFDGAENTIVLASEIFGDEALSGTPPLTVGGGSGANETLVQMDVVSLDLDTTLATLLALGDDIDVGEKASVKFTLGGDAVFGEDLSTTALVNSANGGAGAFTCTAGAIGAAAADAVAPDTECGIVGSNVDWQVVQGGAIGDNTITIEFTNDSGAIATIGGMTFGNIKVKNLVSQLGDKGNHTTFRGKVEFGAEYVEGVDVGDTDGINVTATDDPIVIFGSQPGLKLEGTANNFDTALQNYLRINVGNGEKTFTGGSTDGRKDFDVALDTTVVHLGSIQLKRQDIDASAFADATTGVGVVIKKEFGGDFDFQGGDKHTLSVNVTNGDFQVGGNVYLAPTSACAVGAIPGLSGTTVAVTAGTTGGVTMTLSGNTNALTTQYHLCYSVDGTNPIPEAFGLTTSWHVGYFNTRYDDQAYVGTTYGDLRRNGCIASFFNVPGVGETDLAFIRLTNTSTTNEGPVLATLYAQDGEVIGTRDTKVTDNLAKSATQVYTTLGTSSQNAFGQDLLSIAQVMNVTGDAEQYKGRARLVLKGAFDTCEGLGLLKVGGTGALLNLTATTQGNGPGDGGNNGN